jgi:hypothetical protein
MRMTRTRNILLRGPNSLVFDLHGAPKQYFNILQFSQPRPEHRAFRLFLDANISYDPGVSIPSSTNYSEDVEQSFKILLYFQHIEFPFGLSLQRGDVGDWNLDKPHTYFSPFHLSPCQTSLVAFASSFYQLRKRKTAQINKVH